MLPIPILGHPFWKSGMFLNNCLLPFSMADRILIHRVLVNWAQAHKCPPPVYTEERIHSNISTSFAVTVEMAGHRTRAQEHTKKLAKEIAQIRLMSVIQAGCGHNGQFCLLHADPLLAPEPAPAPVPAVAAPPIIINSNRPVLEAWRLTSRTYQYVVMYTDGSVEATMTEFKSRQAQNIPLNEPSPIMSQTFADWDHWKQYLNDRLIFPLRGQLSSPEISLPFSERNALEVELDCLVAEYERPSPLRVE